MPSRPCFAVRAGLAACVVALACLAAPSDLARACGVIPCFVGESLPNAGTVPANAQALLWKKGWRSDAQPLSETLHLYTFRGSTRVELPFTSTADGELVRIKPNELVAEGSELLLEIEVTPCEVKPGKPFVRVRVAQAAARPTQLGTLQAGALVVNPEAVPSGTGCGLPPPAVYVPLRLVPSETLTPYADGLRHALVVDGVEQPQYHAATPGFVPSSLAGTLEDRLIARCASTMPYYKSFEPGSHRVQWVSRLIDGSELRSDELEVALRCPDATADAPKQDAGAAPKQDAGAPSVNPADASVPSAESDAAITRDAAAATDTEETNAAEVEDSGVSAAPIHDNISNVASADHAGCSVSSLRRGHSALSWALTLLVACFMQARLRSRCRDSK